MIEAETQLKKYGVNKLKCYLDGISAWTKVGGQIEFPRFIKFQVNKTFSTALAQFSQVFFLQFIAGSERIIGKKLDIIDRRQKPNRVKWRRTNPWFCVLAIAWSQPRLSIGWGFFPGSLRFPQARSFKFEHRFDLSQRTPSPRRGSNFESQRLHKSAHLFRILQRLGEKQRSCHSSPIWFGLRRPP